MNFVMFVIGLALPLTISGYSLLKMNPSFVMDKAAENIASNGSGIISTLDDDFTTKLKLCIVKEAQASDFKQCLENEAVKIRGISGPSDPKIQCCARVISYECMKKFLTSACSVSKEEVDSHDDEHFNFWNDVDVPQYPHHCSGGRSYSENYCFSDSVGSTTQSGTTHSGTTPSTKATTTVRTGSSSAKAYSIPLQLTLLFLLYLFASKIFK